MSKTIKPERQILYALTADKYFLELVEKKQFVGKIEQVFNKAVNIFSNDRIYSLICSTLDNAPNSCRLLNNDLSTIEFSVDDLVYFSNNKLFIGNGYIVSFVLCHLWQYKKIIFDMRNLCSSEYKNYLIKQINLINKCVSAENKTLFLYQDDNLFYRSMADTLAKMREKLINGLVQKKESDIRQSIKGLVGLGIGLTPSGDDYLCGLSAFLFLNQHPGNEFKLLFEDAVISSESNTNLLSFITIKQCIQQEYRESTYQLVKSLAEGNESDLYQQIMRIINIGSSSGCDMLLGIHDALCLTHYFGEKNVHQNCY